MTVRSSTSAAFPLSLLVDAGKSSNDHINVQSRQSPKKTVDLNSHLRASQFFNCLGNDNLVNLSATYYQGMVFFFIFMIMVIQNS